MSQRLPGSADLHRRQILVTGGSGFIGTRVVQALCAAGATVLSLDLAPPRHPIPRPSASKICDIRSTRLADHVRRFSPNVVLHLAAQVDVCTSEHEPAVDAEVNVTGTIAVARAATAAGATLIHASTCAVFGAARRLPAGENEPLTPTTPYGLSKAAAIGYVEWFARRCGLNATTLILGNVYGPGSTRGVLTTLFADAAAGRPSTLHGRGRATRDFVHIDDVTNAVLAACTAPAAGRVNIASGTETSIACLHSLVGRITGRPIEPVLVAEPDGGVARMCLRISRAANVLGWRPRTTLVAGITKMASGMTTAHRSRGRRHCRGTELTES